MAGIALLAAPALWAFDAPGDPRGTEISQSHVKWEWERVAGAETYEVIVDGTHIDETVELYYHSFNLWAGEHSLTVRGKKRDGAYSERTPTIKIIVSEWYSPGVLNRSFVVGPDGLPIDGQTSDPVIIEGYSTEPEPVIEVVLAPSNPRGSVTNDQDILWQWDAVGNASFYDVIVDGTYSGSATGTDFMSLSMGEGQHTMSVKAVTSTGILSEDSVLARVNIEAPTVAVASAPPPPVPVVVEEATAPTAEVAAVVIPSVEPEPVVEAPTPIVSAPVSVISTPVVDAPVAEPTAPVVQAVSAPVDNRQAIDMYLLTGQSNASIETFQYLGHTLTFEYHDHAESYAAAHWNRGGASIEQWIDSHSNKQQYWFSMMEQLQIEVDAQLAAGKKLRSVNLIWIQGENDALDGTANYEAMFTALVETWNEDISHRYGVPAYVSSGLPWIQPCHNLWNAYFKDGLPPIRQAQINVANRYEYVATWETSDIYRGDCVHIGDFWLSTSRAVTTAMALQEAAR